MRVITKTIRSHHTRNNSIIIAGIIIIIFIFLYKALPEKVSFEATDTGFIYKNQNLTTTIKVEAYSNSTKLDFSKANKNIEKGNEIIFGVNFSEHVDNAKFILETEKKIEKKQYLIYRSEISSLAYINPIGTISYKKRWVVYDFTDLIGKNPNSLIKEREENNTVVIEIYNVTNLDPTITEETQADFDDGIFTNTTTDIHGNGSVRLTEDAVLIMNFDVNGTLSGKVTDISNNENDGTLVNGPFWNQSNGKYGSAYEFDGVDDYININDSDSLDIIGPFTITSWVYWKAGGTLNSFIVYKEGSPTAYGLTICANGGCGGGDGRVDLSLNQGAGWTVHRSDGVITQNTWNHVAAVYDTSVSEVRIYINGILDKTFTGEAGNVQINSGPLSIGRESTQASEYFSGLLDGIRIYNRSLSAAEILALNNSYQTGKYYSSGKYLSSTLIDSENVTWKNVTARIAFNGSDTPINTTQLVGWWKFNETTGSTAYDYSGSGYDGTLQNSPTVSENSISDYAMKFNGNNTYINISSATTGLNFAGTAPFSLESWVKIPSTGGGGVIISKYNFGVSGQYEFIVGGSGQVTFHREVAPWGLGSNGNITINKWNHVVATYDGATMKIYINGLLDITQSRGAQADDSVTPVLIGSDLSGGAPRSLFNGTIDEVRVWSRYLTDTEIFENYRRGIAKQGGNITLQISTSADNITWTSLSSEVVLQDNVTINLPDVASGQYLNYTLNFKTNDTSATSYLFNISFSGDTTFSNNAPNINNPVISPSIAYKSLVLNASLTPIDNESTLLNVTFQWYKNGNSIYNFTDLNQNNNSVSTAILTNGNFSHFDNVSVCAYADDGQNISSIKCAANVTILNSAPDAGVIISNPIKKYGWVAWNYTDNDTDLQNGTVYTWFIDGTEVWKDQSLVGYWRLDGNALDSSGNNNHGQIQNGPINLSKDGITKGAYKFNGINNYINVSASFSLNITNAITISAWVKINQFSPANIVAKSPNSVLTQNVPYSLGGYQGFIFNVSNSTNSFFVNYPTTEGVWHNVIGTYNGSNMSLYIDGLMVNSTLASGLINKSSAPLFIGGVFIPFVGVRFPFNGTIDEVKIYNRSLSSVEAMQEYQQMKYGQTEKDWNASSTGGTPANDIPNLLYHFDEGNGTQTRDYFENNIGILKGSPNWSVGKYNSKALSFDATGNQLINTSFSPIMNITKAITIEAWIKPFGTSSGRGWVVQKPLNSNSINLLTDVHNFTSAETQNTTSDTHDNTSISLAEDAVLIMNFDVNGSLSNKITDISSNGFDGTLDGNPYWNESGGRHGSAYVFNGINNYINISNPNEMKLSGNITISAWINFANLTFPNNQWIFSKWDINQKHIFVLALNDTDLVAIRGSQPTLGANANISKSLLSTNTWYYISSTVEMNSGHPTVKIYLNGALMSNISNNDDSDTDDNDGIEIGANIYNGVTAYYFNGSIDDLRIYNRTLSAAEILALNNSYQSGKYYFTGTYKSQISNQTTNVTWITVIPNISINGDMNNFNHTDLVGWWKFNETTGSIAYDYSGSGNNGTLQNSPARSENSISNYAMNFDGVNQYVRVTDNPSLRFGSNNFSLSIWFKASNAGEVSIISKDDVGNSNKYYKIDKESNNQITFAIWDGITAKVIQSSPIDYDKWYHVVGVKSGDILYLYLNGLLVNSTTSALDINTDSSADFGIGALLRPSPVGFWNGTIDEVMVFNRSLSSGEVYDIYKNQLTSKALSQNITIQFQSSRDNTIWSTSTPSILLQDGVEEGIPVPDGQYLNYTITFNTNDTSVSPYIFNLTFKTTNENSGTNSWLFGHTESGAVFFALTNETSNSKKDLPGSIVLKNNTWYHVAGVWNGTHQKLYVNGTLDGTREFLGTINLTDSPLMIGSSDINSNGFNGTIDEVAIYSRALSDLEINQSYLRDFPHFGYKPNTIDSNLSVLIEPNDGYSFGSFMTVNVTVTNSVSEATNVLLLPLVAKKSTTLNASVVAIDNDTEDSLTVMFKWFNNSINVINNTITDIVNGTNVTNTISNTLYSHFGNISVEIIIDDSVSNATFINSSIVQISNSQPSVTTPTLSPSNPITITTINASVIVTDNDTDSMTVTFRWYKNNLSLYNNTVLNQFDGSTTSILSPSNFTSKDNISVEVYADDSYTNSTFLNSTYVTIGSISSCITISAPGDYVLTQNILNSNAERCINITASNVTLDGQGYTIDGIDTLSSHGIYIYNSSFTVTNVTVKNFNLTDWFSGITLQLSDNNTLMNITTKSNTQYGIYLNYANGNIIINNSLTSNGYGIQIETSNNNTISNNTANFNTNEGIYLRALDLYNTVTNNIANSNGDSGIFLDAQSNYNLIENNTAVSNSYTGLFLKDNSDYNTINNNTALSNTYYGIFLTIVNNTVINNNNASSNNMGIRFESSNFNIVNNNTANSNSNHGILLIGSSNNNITNNTVGSNSNIGIYLLSSSISNNIEKNIINSNTFDGMILDSSNSNNIINNTANSNGRYGIYLTGSSNVLIENNTANSDSSGIDIEFSSNNVIVKYNNVLSSLGHGVYLYSINDVYMERNNVSLSSANGINSGGGTNTGSIINNTLISNGGSGIFFVGSDTSIENNTAYSNGDSGIKIYAGGSNSAKNNIIYSNNYGIYILSTNSNNLTNNSIANNTNDIYIDSGTNNIFTNNFVSNSARSITGNTFINTTFGYTYPTKISFTHQGNITLNSVILPPGDPTGYKNISKYINITNSSLVWILLNISYTNTDAENITEPNLTLRSYNGSWQNLTSSSNGLNIIDNYIYANVTFIGNSSIISIQAQNVNNEPHVSTPIISPITSYKHNILNATTTPTDNESTLMNVTFQWYNNGNSIYNFTALNQNNNSDSTAILTNGNFSHFDNVSVCVFANDGESNSNTACSSSLQIQNTNPESISLGLFPNNARKTTIMNASVIAIDNDTDSMSVTFRWMKNNFSIRNNTIVNVANGTNVTNILTSGNFSHFDNISVEIQIEDPYANGTFVNSSIVQIQNTEPEATNFLLNPITANKNTIFNASVIPIDNDTDTMSVTFRWYNNSVNIINNTITGVTNGTNVTNTILIGLYSHFGNISVEIQIEDPYTNSTFVNSSTVQIQNIVPEINITSLDKWPAFYMLPLNASAIVLDEDLDTLIVNFSWIINNSIYIVNNSVSSVANGTNVTNTISNTNYNIGDNITVEIKIFDGYNISLFVNTTTLEILPNIPYVTQPIIDPQEAFTDSTLTTSSGIYHPTSQLLNVTFKWYKNNIYVINNTILNQNANTTATATFLYTNFTRYDNISVEVYAFDGVNYSVFKNSTPVQIQKRITRVTFRLDFNINGTSNDMIFSDKNTTGFFIEGDITNKFGCVQDKGAYGIIFSGETFVNLNSSVSPIPGNSYDIRMTQNEQGDGFIIPITTGDCNDVRIKMPTIQSDKMLTEPFDIAKDSRKYPLELTTEYRDIDIVGDIDRSGTFIIELEKNSTNQIIARVR